MSATGGIVAPAGTNILGATLAAAGPAIAGGACVGSGTRIAAAAHAACAAARSITGRGAGSSSARTGAGTPAGSSTRPARLRVGETDRRTRKQRTQGHRENCLSHASTPFDVVLVKRGCLRMFLRADDKLSQFVRNDVVQRRIGACRCGDNSLGPIQRPATLSRLQFFPAPFGRHDGGSHAHRRAGCLHGGGTCSRRAR